MLCTCQAGYEEYLARELAGRALRERERGPGWVLADAAPGAPTPDLAFAHLLLGEPARVTATTVNSLGREIAEAFGISLRGERIDAEWPECWLSAPEPVGLGKRTAAVSRVFDRLIQERLPRVAKLGRRDLPREMGPARGWFVWFTAFDAAWVARTATINGPRRMADDPRAPSRSYLKVEEAYLLVGAEPAAGESVADLGAAPGGWSYSAASRGARVKAIDNGPLKQGALDHPLIEHLRSDAFSFRPPAPFDWLFCDLVEDPRRVLREIVRPWLESRWCRRFVVNLKFGRVDPMELLDELRSPSSPLALASSLRIRHLYHDREEFTVAGILPGP